MQPLKLLTLITWMTICSSVLAQKPPPSLSPEIQVHLDHLAAHGDSRSLDQALKCKIDLTESPSFFEHQFKMIASLNQFYDSNFDANPGPPVFLNLAPGNGADGHFYDSGIDPSRVKEPDVRADYEKRIAENQANGERQSIQILIRKYLADLIVYYLGAEACDLKMTKEAFDAWKRTSVEKLPSPIRKRFKLEMEKALAAQKAFALAQMQAAEKAQSAKKAPPLVKKTQVPNK